MLTDITTLGTSTNKEKFPPTEEQQRIIEAFQTGDSLKIEALAGTGKTTTLNMLANSMPHRSGLYVCYNKQAADEAKERFPANTKCSTAHSLAYREVGHKFRDRLNAQRIPPWEMAEWLGVKTVFYINSDVSLAPMFVTSRVLETVRKFCYSAESEIQSWHVPTVPGAEDFEDKIQKFILPLANKVWEDLQKPTGYCKFEHDHYLKIWALTKPKLDYSYIMLDEAQDTNPLVGQLFMAQTHAQQIAVGDRFQSLYGWRGAKDFLSTLKAENHLYLTKSFRFGPVVAAEGQKWLRLLGSDQVLKGYEKVVSSLGTLSSPEVILCRTNAAVILEAIGAQQVGRKVAIVGGAGALEKLAKAADDLMKGKRSLHPDVAAFENWSAVVEYSLTPEGSDLRTFVRLIEEHGTQVLRQVANATVTEKEADVIISTGHRSKGREWSTVRISPDFDGILTEEGKVSKENMMLAYVCVTRAQHVLDRGGLAFVDELDF